MMNGDRKEGICRLNVDGNGCDYLRILSDLETKLRNNTNPKEKIELALQGALMFYGADRAYVIEVDDELGIGVNTYECCAPGIAPEIDNLQFYAVRNVSALALLTKERYANHYYGFGAD